MGPGLSWPPSAFTLALSASGDIYSCAENRQFAVKNADRIFSYACTLSESFNDIRHAVAAQHGLLIGGGHGNIYTCYVAILYHVIQITNHRPRYG